MKIYKFVHQGRPRFGVLDQPGHVRLLAGSPFDAGAPAPLATTGETLPLAGLALLAPTVEAGAVDPGSCPHGGGT